MTTAQKPETLSINICLRWEHCPSELAGNGSVSGSNDCPLRIDHIPEFALALWRKNSEINKVNL